MTDAQGRYASLGNALFTGTQQRLLSFIFGQPQRSFFANELIKITGSGSGAVQREIKRLADSGLVTISYRGNQKHIQANPDCPIFADLCNIVQKTFAMAAPLTDALGPLSDRIDLAFIYGSIAKQHDTASSDIDLMIVTDALTYGEILTALAETEVRLGRRINPTVYSREELASRIREENAFVSRVMVQPKIWLKGSDRDLTL